MRSLRSNIPGLLEAQLGNVDCVCFSPDGSMLAAGGQRGELKVWRVADWKEVASLSVASKPATGP